jgi:hypothetical protein
LLPDAANRDFLEIESDREAIVLRTVPENPSLTKEQGVWVLYTGDPLPASATDEVLQQLREECDLASRGKAARK